MCFVKPYAFALFFSLQSDSYSIFHHVQPHLWVKSLPTLLWSCWKGGGPTSRKPCSRALHKYLLPHKIWGITHGKKKWIAFWLLKIAMENCPCADSSIKQPCHGFLIWLCWTKHLGKGGICRDRNHGQNKESIRPANKELLTLHIFIQYYNSLIYI